MCVDCASWELFLVSNRDVTCVDIDRHVHEFLLHVPRIKDI